MEKGAAIHFCTQKADLRRGDFRIGFELERRAVNVAGEQNGCMGERFGNAEGGHQCILTSEKVAFPQFELPLFLLIEGQEASLTQAAHDFPCSMIERRRSIEKRE